MQIEKRVLARNTRYETPYYVIHGELEGPVVLITAGIHGNEVGSIQAAKRLLRELRQGKLQLHAGTLLIIPIVNKAAFLRRIRGIPDLNRTFPRRRDGKARHPLAAALMRIAKRYQPDWLLDLHEANGYSNLNRGVLGQSLVTHRKSPSAKISRAIIRDLNHRIPSKKRKFTLQLHHKPGSARFAMVRQLQAKAVTVETSWHLPFQQRTKYQLAIVNKFLKKMGMTQPVRDVADAEQTENIQVELPELIIKPGNTALVANATNVAITALDDLARHELPPSPSMSTSTLTPMPMPTDEAELHDKTHRP